MENKDLEQFYNRVYKKGERGHYTSLLLSGDNVPPAKAEVMKEIGWKGKTVLDAGCGTGELPYLIAQKGALRVVGVDYSKEAIGVAQKTYALPNLSYVCEDIKKIKGKFDVITTLGTLEHVDDPLGVLRQLKRMLKPGGSLIVTCPNWTNPRGYILQTLRMLFDARITLADIHFFTPLEFEMFARKLGMTLAWKTVEQSWGHGEKCIDDLRRRLPNVVRDSKLRVPQRKIDEFIAWLQAHIVTFEKDAKHTGAVALYHLKK